MSAAESHRNQHFDRLTEQFVARVPEELLRLRVDERDVPAPVDEHLRIWRPVDDGVEEAFFSGAPRARGMVPRPGQGRVDILKRLEDVLQNRLIRLELAIDERINAPDCNGQFIANI